MKILLSKDGGTGLNQCQIVASPILNPFLGGLLVGVFFTVVL